MLPKNLQDSIKLQDLVLRNNNEIISFCGLIECEGKLNIFLPRKMNSEDSHTSACHLMSSLLRYATNRQYIVSEDEAEEKLGLSSLSLMYEILTDYREYGIYTRRSVRTTLNNGRSNWKKTIQRVLPAEGSGGRPIYPEIYTQKKFNSASNDVSLIHSELIKLCDEQLGWWLTGKPNGSIASDISAPKDFFISHGKKIHLLKSELQHIYSERDIRLINNLIFLLEEQYSSSDGFIAGVKDFQYMWEHMINSVLGGIDIVNELPKPTYIFAENNKAIPSQKGMRPDIVLKLDDCKHFVVIDAKYYSATTSENSPGWSDIVKQFYYAKGLEIIYPKAKIKNYFAFPGHERVFSRIELNSKILDQELLNLHFPPIHCVYIDPSVVIENYSNRNTMLSYRKKLFSTIEDIHHS